MPGGALPRRSGVHGVTRRLVGAHRLECAPITRLPRRDREAPGATAKCPASAQGILPSVPACVSGIAKTSVIYDTPCVSLADNVAHVLVVGDVAKMLRILPDEIDTIAGVDARVIRTVLRSEVFRILASGPLDVVITASDASFLGGDKFLAAFAARVLPVSLLMLTRTSDEPTCQRLRAAGVQVEHIAPPIALEALRERVRLALLHSKLASTARREPLTQLVRRIHGERGSLTVHVHAGAEYGSLTFLDGVLVDAQSARHTGDAAAEDILGWHHTGVVFDRMIPPTPPTVKRKLAALIAAAESTDRMPDAPGPAIRPSTSDEILPPNLVFRPSLAEIRSIQQPSQSSRKTEENMANINKTLEELMKIDGAIGVAIADWDSGLCLGTAGGGARLNIEVAAAGNCQVVKAKMSTMSELGIKGAIQDILITLDDQIHLIRPLRHGENIFLYLAIDKAKGNLAMARHRLTKAEAELSL